MNTVFAALLNAGILSGALAVIVAIALRLVPRRVLNAATRYVLWWAVLAVTIALPAIYLPWNYCKAKATVAVRQGTAPQLRTPDHITPLLPGPSAEFIVAHDTPAYRLVPVPLRAGWWTQWFGIGWALASLSMILRLAASYFHLAYRKKTAMEASPDWAARVDNWLTQCGSTRRGVRLAVLQDLGAPMAVGPQAPYILIPARLFQELKSDELEQIGLHEAAHFARYDDYGLMVQRCIEAVFVLHPVVRFVARCLDLQREIACDDLVVGATGQPRIYAECLARVAELMGAGRAPLTAAAAIEGRSHLGSRVEVLLDKARNSNTRVLKLRFTAAIAVLVTLSWMGAKSPAMFAFAGAVPLQAARVHEQNAAVPPGLLAQVQQVPAAPVSQGGGKAAASPLQEEGRTSSGFAVSTFPAQYAVGKRLRLSGFIKTEGVAHGYAGLWLRADRRSPGTAAGPNTLAFDDMRGRGATGTEDWKRYELTLAIPADTKVVNFGTIHTGEGTAWFDSLSIEVDGVPYRDDFDFDLDFESPTPRGFFSGSDRHGIQVDPQVAHSGKQSLRMTYGETTPNTARWKQPGGFAYLRFPIDEARGKRLRFSAYIKTQEVNHGSVGLSCAVRGPSPANDEVSDAMGTIDWKLYSCEVPVANDAVAVHLQASHSGDGISWLDTVQVDLDGVPYNNAYFDFDFETADARGFDISGGSAFGARVDKIIFHTGKQSLRLEYGGTGSIAYSYAGATGSFPVHLAAGKKVRFSGYIKTEAVQNGFAGLWWRVDGKSGVLAFAGMDDIGAKGTTDWRRYEIEVTVPAEATNINFGAIHPGDGTAWFDDLAIDLDGVPFHSLGFDLTFEDTVHYGFQTFGDRYVLGSDRQVFHGGAQSLRMAYLRDAGR